MIASFWPEWFRKLVFQNGSWPKSYCAIDVETTGYSHNEDVVTEWGHCLVEDGEVVDRLSLVIDWTGRDAPPEWWVERKLRQVRQGMEMKGKTYHIDSALMRAEGMKPEKAFNFIARFCDQIRAKGIPFVAHNGFFDEKMLSANFLQFKFGAGFSYGDRYIDTAGIEKANQLLENQRMHPKMNDTLRSYFTRVQYTRVQGVLCNMEPHCATKYNFAGKYGITQKQMHGAKTDSYCCHVLMQEYAALLTEAQTPPVYPTEDSKASRKTPRAVPAAPVAPNQKRLRGQRRS